MAIKFRIFISFPQTIESLVGSHCFAHTILSCISKCKHERTRCVITCAPHEEVMCSRCVLCSSRRVDRSPPWNRSRKPYISIATISIVCWPFEHHASPELSLLSAWKLALLWVVLYCFSCLENAEWLTCEKMFALHYPFGGGGEGNLTQVLPSCEDLTRKQ